MMVKVGDILPCHNGKSYRITGLELVMIAIRRGINFYVAELEDPDGDEDVIPLGAGPSVPVICPKIWYDERDIRKWVVMETGRDYYMGDGI